MPVIEIGNGINESAVSSLIATAVANLVNSAPSTLDTLNELATALGNDPNFAITITNLLAGKASSSHTHSQSDITNLITDLASKASSSHTHAMSDITGLVTALAGKATPADITTAVNNLVNSAPGVLDTLSELATALGNDPNFATTITSALAGKQATLISGTNIKTINGNSVLGSGDLTVAGSSVNFTYGESITAGDPVYIKESDGKVYKALNISRTYQTSAWDYSCFDICINPSNVICTIGRDSTGNVSVKIGTISGTTITWGTKTDLYASATDPTYTYMVWNSSQNVFLVAYTDGANSQYLTLRAISYSGTTPTLGSAVVALSNTIVSLSVCNFGSTSYVGLAYSSNLASSVSFRTLSLSGTTITANAVLSGTWGFSNTLVNISYDTDTSQIYAMFSTTSNPCIAELSNTSGTLAVIKGSLSTGIAPDGSPYYYGTLEKTTSTNEYVAFSYKGNLYFLTYENHNTILHQAFPLSIGSTNDTFGTSQIPLGISNSSSTPPQFFKVANTLYLTSSANGMVIISIDLLSFKAINNKIVAGIGLANSAGLRQTAINDTLFVRNKINGGAGITGKAVVQNHYQTNAILGIAGATGVLNDSKQIILKGQVYTTTGLTTGASYYITSAGAISTSGIHYIGKALSTTQLLVGA